MDTKVRFGQWEFDKESGEITAQGVNERLEPTVARLLVYLYENQDRVVPREELIQQVWDNRIVSDDPINRSISVLRHVITPEDRQAMIKTIPRKGYRASFPPATTPVSQPQFKRQPKLESQAQPQTVAQPQPPAQAETAAPPIQSASNSVPPPTYPRRRKTDRPNNAVAPAEQSIQAHALSNPFGYKVTALVALACLAVFLLAIEWQPKASVIESKPRLAVLPFQDLSKDESLGHIANGLGETIIHLVSQVDGIAVTARTSSFRYQSNAFLLSQLAEELNVNYVLEGSIQAFNKKLRIVARLIDVESQTELWSQNFTRDDSNIFSVQDEIASAVIISLQGILVEHKERYIPEYENYQRVLKAMDYANRMTKEGTQAAASLLNQVIISEPDYPLPHTLLARVLLDQIRTKPYLQIYPEERQLAQLDEIKRLIVTALSLDPLSAEAHALNGLWYLYQGDLVNAQRNIRTSLEIEPNQAFALAEYAQLLQLQGNVELALGMARKARELDPQSSHVNQILAQTLWLNGKAEAAIKIIQQNLVANPTSANNYTLLARWALQRGEPGQSMLYALQEKQLNPDSPNSHWGVCLGYYQLWQRQAGAQCLQDLLAQFPDYYQAKVWLNYAKPDEVVSIIEARIAQFPYVDYYHLQLAGVEVTRGNYARVLSLLEPRYPQLVNPIVEVNDWSLWAAKLISSAYIATGQKERALPILDATLAHVNRSRKYLAGGFSTGIDDVYSLMLLGKHKHALDRLSQAIDNRWSFYSMFLPFDKVFAPIAQSQEFQDLVMRQQTFMQQQSEWLQRQLLNQ